MGGCGGEAGGDDAPVAAVVICSLSGGGDDGMFAVAADLSDLRLIVCICLTTGAGAEIWRRVNGSQNVFIFIDPPPFPPSQDYGLSRQRQPDHSVNSCRPINN